MDPKKKIGIILILIGIIIPLIALPFVSGFSKEKGFYDNFYNAGIVLGKDSVDSTPGEPLIKGKKPIIQLKLTWAMLRPGKIPFRFILVPTVILIFMGIIRIDRARKRKPDE